MAIKHLVTKPVELKHLEEIKLWWNERVELKDERKDESLTETWKSRKYSIQEIIDDNYNLDKCGFPKKEDVILSPEETINSFIELREKLEKKLDLKLNEIKELIGEK